MKYRVLQRFLTEDCLYIPGDIYVNVPPSKFTKNLVKYEFIEEAEDIPESWEENGIVSKIAGVIIAPEDYVEGDKKHFTFDEALEIEKKLEDGWRLPTRSEWALICEEFGQKDGKLDKSTLIHNLHLKQNGYIMDNNHYDAGNLGYYWSSTALSSTSAYTLYFYSNVFPSITSARYNGLSVRCVKENKIN